MNKKVMLGASLGNCVHVAGVMHFLNLAQEEGYETIFLGPAVKIDRLLEAIDHYRPETVALGYRLTPENVVPIIEELREKSTKLKKQPIWIFGGTGPVAKVVATQRFFNKIFDGTEDLDDCITFLRHKDKNNESIQYANRLIPRLEQKRPYPLLRHHFGLPDFEATRKGIVEIAESGVLDIISLGIDQNTQQFYFHPEKRDPKMDGAGGVPVHNDQEFCLLKKATQTGNHPLLRCYSGTEDVMPFAKVLTETIDNAWCAVPLFWYNELDGRGERSLNKAMTDAHHLIKWHAKQNIPVELNEPHHWGLRDAPDVISVVAAWLSAYHAKKLGVKNYIAQYMFNIPNSMSFSMDLAKVLAQIEMAESFADETFNIYRETRVGLPFLSGDLDLAKGQLAASTMLQMNVHPNIIHVVGYSEAEHAATPAVIIESTKIVRGVIRSCLEGNADATQDETVQQRKTELLQVASYLLDFIRDFYADQSDDPLFDPGILTDCVRRGILDAPHLVKNDRYKGIIETRMIAGKCEVYDCKQKRLLHEKERLELLFKEGRLAADLFKEKVSTGGEYHVGSK